MKESVDVCLEHKDVLAKILREQLSQINIKDLSENMLELLAITITFELVLACATLIYMTRTEQGSGEVFIN
jgi:hypothetical protein